MPTEGTVRQSIEIVTVAAGTGAGAGAGAGFGAGVDALAPGLGAGFAADPPGVPDGAVRPACFCAVPGVLVLLAPDAGFAREELVVTAEAPLVSLLAGATTGVQVVQVAAVLWRKVTTPMTSVAPTTRRARPRTSKRAVRRCRGMCQRGFIATSSGGPWPRAAILQQARLQPATGSR
ncbi:MAG: hypothetical protein FWC48_04500 [Actinomycetia bacterium]|nr:hypothetical protein [Actinomycetes bacterium]